MLMLRKVASSHHDDAHQVRREVRHPAMGQGHACKPPLSMFQQYNPVPD